MYFMSCLLCFVMSCLLCFFLLLLISWVCNLLNHCCLLCLMYQSNVCIIVMSFLCSLFFLSYLPVSSVVYYHFFLNLVLVWSSAFSFIYVFLCRGGCPYFRSGLTQPGMGTRSCIDIHNLEFWCYLFNWYLKVAVNFTYLILQVQ